MVVSTGDPWVIQTVDGSSRPRCVPTDPLVLLSTHLEAVSLFRARRVEVLARVAVVEAPHRNAILRRQRTCRGKESTEENRYRNERTDSHSVLLLPESSPHHDDPHPTQHYL